MSCRIAIASGGTGGHFYPTLAIADELRQRGQQVMLIVAGQHAEEHLRVAAEQKLPAVAVSAVRLRREVGSALAFPLRMVHSILLARRALRGFAPDVVLGMGSFAAAPTCAAAVLHRIPLVLHEGNAWMGRTNRVLSRWAEAAGVALPLDAGCLPRCPTVHVGMPLRQALLETADCPPPAAEVRQEFGLEPDTLTLLVFGGSQGARFINDLMGELARSLGQFDPPIQLIHLTGSDDNEPLERAYRQAGLHARVRRADPDIQKAYVAADLVICRAGASSSCELALFGKPAILIPLPTAADDHQTANARLLARSDAAVHLPQISASVGEVTALLEAWISGSERFANMKRNILEFSKPEAASQMADLCLEHAVAKAHSQRSIREG